MNCINVMVEVAPDGGLVVYAENDGSMSLVFAGNQKETTDYLAKRVGELKPEKVVTNNPYAYAALDDNRVTDFRRTGAIN